MPGEVLVLGRGGRTLEQPPNLDTIDILSWMTLALGDGGWSCAWEAV